MRDPLHSKPLDEADSWLVECFIMMDLMYISLYITTNGPKISPEYATNIFIVWISGYLHCIKLGIFIFTHQSKKTRLLVSTKWPQNSNKPINGYGNHYIKCFKTFIWRNNLEISWTIYLETIKKLNIKHFEATLFSTINLLDFSWLWLLCYHYI